MQRRKPILVNREALVGDQRVVNQPSQVDWAYGHAAHVGVAEDVIQVVPGVAAGNDGLQHVEPEWQPGVVLALVFENQMGDLNRIEFLTFSEWSRRAAPDFANDGSEMIADDDLPELLMGEVIGRQKIIIEKMAEGAVPDVVQ